MTMDKFDIGGGMGGGGAKFDTGGGGGRKGVGVGGGVRGDDPLKSEV